MKYVWITLLCISTFSAVQAQDYYYSKYDWENTPTPVELTEEEKKLDEVFLKYKRSFNLVQVEKGLLEYQLNHRIIKINNDAAIDRNNKFYVYNNGALEIKMQKARVINPDGKIVELSEKDILESKDEEGNVNYQYFALEGIVVGSIIEYLDVMVYLPKLTGASIFVQSGIAKKNVELDIICPKFLEYLIYNNCGLPEFKKDSTDYFENRFFVKIDKIDALEEESWAAYDASLKKYYFKLNKNNNSNRANFYNYGEVSNDIHARMFAPISKKELSSLKKFIEKTGADKLEGTENKIRAIENTMKKEIGVIDASIENGENIDFILSKKITSEDGFMKLFINCLRELNINFELVVTCDRNENKFLTEFEGYNFLQDFMIYVKETDQYLTHMIMYRLGITPEAYAFNKGLFISEVKIGDMVTGVGKVKEIKGLKSDKSVDEIHTKVTFTPDFESTQIELKRVTTGYKSQPYQAVFDFLEEDRKTELRESYLKYLDESAKLENMTFENDQSDLTGVKPLIGSGTLSSASFVEKGGDNYLFKVGMLIGPQSDLYNSKNRKLPVETPYARKYYRTIEVQIPEGYIIKNVEDLNKTVKPEGNNLLGFTSTYTLEGNVLKIVVNEWYDSYFYSLEDYLKYETVINAASDFNKIVLVLQKKK